MKMQYKEKLKKWEEEKTMCKKKKKLVERVVPKKKIRKRRIKQGKFLTNPNPKDENISLQDLEKAERERTLIMEKPINFE
jgi:hypothetical protein